ncbi:hypothetical protein MMC24_001043 [Lignoscripta atroalba]|nr:hypothetical protein [Lignoscripta atroalba]
MASLPAQSSASQRQRPSSPPVSEGTSLSENRTSKNPPSTTSEDSQTVLLNNPPSSSTSPTADGRQKQVQSQPEASIDNEPRKCWICFADETEDTPTSSAWRSPCPCALTAHESCLLDWVADLEAPNQRKRTGAPARIQCPQCKSDITIARPRSIVVEGVNAVERVTGKLVLPGIFITIAGTMFTGCWVHGLSSVYLVFGREDFLNLLGDSGQGISTKWGLGLPLIPVVLVMSRTTLADSLLPVLPIFFFATQIPDRHMGNLDLWPPSAAMTIASLPYLRGAYNEVYKRLFSARDQRWMKEIQPRAGENGDDAGAGHEEGNDLDVDEGGVNVAFELDLQVGVLEEEADVVVQNHHNQQAQPAVQGAEGANHAPAPQPQHQQAPPLVQNNLIVSTSRLADTIIGALFFPTISAAMGTLLKLSLPKRWTTASPPRLSGPWDRNSSSSLSRPGLLQTRWGRSIVGGCLFVVLKDTLLLYSRYRLAKDHRMRRVLNYDRGVNNNNKRRGKGVPG